MSYSKLNINTLRCFRAGLRLWQPSDRYPRLTSETSAGVYLHSPIRDLVASCSSGVRDGLCIYLFLKSFLCICHSGDSMSLAEQSIVGLFSSSVRKGKILGIEEGKTDYFHFLEFSMELNTILIQFYFI